MLAPTLQGFRSILIVLRSIAGGIQVLLALKELATDTRLLGLPNQSVLASTVCRSIPIPACLFVTIASL